MSRDDAAGKGASLERDHAAGNVRAPARKKSAPPKERALRVIDEDFPGRVPDQATLPNKCLCELVSKGLQKRGLLKVSDTTILRAAGRRKDGKYGK